MRKGSIVKAIVFLIAIVLIECFAYLAVDRFSTSVGKTVGLGIKTNYLVLSAIWLSIFFLISRIRNSKRTSNLINFGLVFFMAFFVLKAVLALFRLLDECKRLLSWLGSLLYDASSLPSWLAEGMNHSDLLWKISWVVGGIIFFCFFYGISNRHRYKVQRLTLSFKNLPKSFTGFTIVQLSDIHSGSFTNRAGVQKGVDLVNSLQPDLVLFTGDLVNNKADEMLDYLDIFKQIKGNYGVFSILGNHDYGDYHQWKTPEQKKQNLQQLKDLQQSMGWQLLLDETVQIEKEDESISLIGVENISSSFSSYGNLPKAFDGAEKSKFKILMSHDPSHWSTEVLQDFKDIDLTLSGHTHGFQFGIDAFGIKWSPAQYVYKQWAGLYQEGEQFIYVNRGFGFLGYPGRVGILPEITYITLQTK